MRYIDRLSLLFALILGQSAGPVFSQIKSGPGDRGEFAFTVSNPADSVGALENPHIVYPDKPWWFNMSGTLSYPSIPPGGKQEMVLEYSIADNAPSGTYPLNFKVVFSNPNVFPPFWKPAENVAIMIVGGAPPEPANAGRAPGKKRAKARPAAAKAAARKTKPAVYGAAWPDINYGNKCHSAGLFPAGDMARVAPFGTGGIKIRFRMFSSEPEPCKAGPQCKVIGCEDLRTAVNAPIQCISGSSKIYLSPCVFSAPKYPAEAVAAAPEVLDPNSKVREKAVAATDLSAAAGLKLAYAALKDPSPDVRIMGILRLDELDGDSALPALCEAARDSNAGVAHYAAMAVGVMESTAAMRCLQEAAGHASEDVRLEAAYWLYSHYCGNRPDGAGVSAVRLPRETCEKYSYAGDSHYDDRAPAFKANYETLKPYIKALEDGGDIEAKYDAERTLNAANGRVAVRALLTAMSDPDRAVAWGAAMALAHYDDPRSIEPFIKGLRSADEDIQMNSAIGLKAILKHMKVYEAYEPLAALARVPSERTQASAVSALSEFRVEENAGLFSGLALNGGLDRNTRMEAASALASIHTDKACGLLAAVLDRNDDATRCAAACTIRFDFCGERVSQAAKTKAESAYCECGG